MKIIEARVIVTCPGRNLITLKIVTDSGLYGIGDATLNGRELAVVAYLEEHVLPALIGRDAQRIEEVGDGADGYAFGLGLQRAARPGGADQLDGVKGGQQRQRRQQNGYNHDASLPRGPRRPLRAIRGMKENMTENHIQYTFTP